MMGPIIAKLTTILSWNYRLPGNIEDGIHLLKDRLSTMDDVLQMLADMDQVHPRARDWRNKVRELSYDIEDSIDRFMLNHSHGPHGGSKVNFISKALQKAEILLQDRGSVASQSVHLDPRVPALFEARDLVGIDGPQLDPRVTALFAEARDLVGIDGPREEIIQLLNVDEKQHKVVSIYGTGGQGKTTLAMQVYIKITEAFDCRAFVSLSPTLDIKKIFGDILFQLDKNKFNQTQSWDAEQLIRTTREHLVDKR
ncbi:hypothetical protein HU200_040961 [Digitaria exilis]|uniref:Uncharacterized protein n=1 Tax=Digitaria exilis TaxID=1010633 RepID=A0A835BG08_9POAL|nr:hypothetical protein HU200_040961 [Digitaria exilis]